MQINNGSDCISGATPIDPKKVAIIGGGPGGLMAAYLLNREPGIKFEVTLFEASSRLGGKILTGNFETIDARFEAGTAELYDYSQLGPDPLKELIASLGLKTTPMTGPTVILDEKFLTTDQDILHELGAKTFNAIENHYLKAEAACSPAEYYESDWKSDNEDRLSKITYAQYLDSIEDESARRYVEIAVHSDLATEPHHTTAMYGIQNWLMNSPGYMQLYSIDGGIEKLPQELVKQISARKLMKHSVTSVGLTKEGKYQVTSRSGKEKTTEEFDFVITALPQNWLPRIRWEGRKLAKAMRAHTKHYDHPAHYLRVTIAFEKPFWGEWVKGSYFILDAFGGCCVYDESSRDPGNKYGVLSWLIAGEAAATFANFDKSQLVTEVLNSLPGPLQQGRNLILEAKVHSWINSVNGLPMGYPAREPASRHLPEPIDHPNLFLVGDYLFDSTLNGVLDSAETAVDCIAERVKKEILAQTSESNLQQIPTSVR